jgi:protein farnesyltransferase subunit beta
MDFLDESHCKYDEEGYQTTTSNEQCSCEKICVPLLYQFKYCTDENTLNKWIKNGLVNVDSEIRLLRSKHIAYLLNNLEELPGGFVSLDASRPWIIYWILHSVYLLGKDLSLELKNRIISTLRHIQNKSGGYGGGPRQISQGAPNYAAVLSLCEIGSQEALSSINRAAMYHWFLSLKDPITKGFSIHNDGEVDSRGTYTIICIARLLNILTSQLTEGVDDFILSCQTYEGGFGGEPSNEAHGGYNFCAMAILLILRCYDRCNLMMLEHWLLNRQMREEGGFQGRTNKLVDSCYSFWQGAAIALLEMMKRRGTDVYDLERYEEDCKRKEEDEEEEKEIERKEEEELMNEDSMKGKDTIPGQEGEVEEVVMNDNNSLHVVSDYSGILSFNQKALQRYILHCGQAFDNGGMRDKPGKPRDFYHCCYSLSGLSVSQRSIVSDLETEESRRIKIDFLEKAKELMNDGDIDEVLPSLDDYYSGPQVRKSFVFFCFSIFFSFPFGYCFVVEIGLW